MTPRNFYRNLMWGIKDAEIRAIAAVMAEHIGEDNAVTMPALCGRVGMSERKVRIILERMLKEYGIPVCANSGQAGRWLALQRAETKSSELELRSRARELVERADAYQRCQYPPAEKVEPTAPKLFDEPIDYLAYWRR